MIFALKLTLVLHSGLQSVVLFIFHTFCVHTELFALNICVRACVCACVRACVYEIIYSLFFPYKFCSLAPYPQVHLCLDAKHMQLHTLQARLHIVQALIV